MTTEHEQTNKSPSLSVTHFNSSRKMEGWFKLMETIRQTDPPTNEPVRLLPNSNLNNTFTNGISSQQRNLFTQSFGSRINNNTDHLLNSSDFIHTTIALDSPPNIFNSPSIVSLASTPGRIADEILCLENELAAETRLRRESIPFVEIDSTPSSSSISTDSRQSPARSKKPRTRKTDKPVVVTSSVRSIGISTPITENISDDDMPLIDLRKQKNQFFDTLANPPVNDTSIPLATDLQSLPGHIQTEQRDVRFLHYNDIDTLSTHLHTCLYVDQSAVAAAMSSPTRPDILKARQNVLNKIFRIYYIKTFQKNLYLEKKVSFIKKDHQTQQPLSLISSPTSTSFKVDWNVNQRNSSSSRRHTPKNVFHILQLQPKKQFSEDDHSSSRTPKSRIETFESIKDILARTYYPHLHTAIEYGYHFGEKSKFPSTHQLISTHDDIVPIKEMPQSPDLSNDSTTITLKSPPSTTRRDSTISQPSPVVTKTRHRQSNDSKTDDVPSLSSQARNCENGELSSWKIKKSVVLLTPTKIPLSSKTFIEKEKASKIDRKRKSPTTMNTNVIETKKKRVTSATSSENINHFEHIIESESDEDVLPSELPKQYFIKNGLRSNYYKTKTNEKSKSTSNKTRLERRRRQSSSSLPPFYTGIFECDDDESSHIDYRLPYDIYWHNQQKATQATVIDSSRPLSSAATTATTPVFHHQKKKSNEPKQKQPSPYKKIFRNTYTDQIRQNLLSSCSVEKAPVCNCKPPDTCEDGICLNRRLFTECLPTCACVPKCSNQKIRRNQWFKHLEVFDTGKYGQGLRTTSAISKGTFLCEYVGEVITDEKFHERMTNLYSKEEHHYTMKLIQNLVIDAYRMGSIARFANHSCSPNCEFEKWTVDGLERMCMFSLRSIKPGEELTYDYNFQCFNLQAQQPCYCESPKCRGTIGTKQQSTVSITTNNNTNNHDNHHYTTTMQRLTQRDKRMVVQSSIFLLRNLRRIKAKQELRKKNSNKSQQQNDKQSAIPLFFPQNYYHSNGSNHTSTLASLRKTPKIAHKDMFYLFYNHIRRSHFVKTGRHHHELIEKTCYYAQLAQLTLILNEIFESILYYKCLNEDITPSNALKKCPSKRLYPAYYEIITKPIDLTLIRNRLDNGEYLSFHLFEQDLLLLFRNAITYCGANSDEARAVLELKNYFLKTLKVEYKTRFNLFVDMQDEQRTSTNLHTLEHFIGRLHEKETRDGQIRQILYDIIYNIEENSEESSPIIYKIVLDNKVNSHRTSKSRTSSDCIVHCRCGSVYDEISLVQCYACQLWQHVACVSIGDSSRPYYCFECQPTCEHNPSACLKTNVLIAATLSPLQTYDDNHNSYSTLTRSDGFIIRINECYFVPKQDQKNIDRSLVSPEYDILFVERLWFDDDGIGQVSGFYYIRPNETFHEPSRKFFPNEVFRFPSSNDPLPISCIVRPCFVFDFGTYCKGKPICDNSSRVLPSDLFICEYRVDKTARTFTRLVKSRHFPINIKSYCFDNYVEKLSIKRDYQPYQKEVQQQQQHYHHHYDNRRRAIHHSNKLTNKQLEERRTRINGIIEKIYCRYHDQTSMPSDRNYTIEQLIPKSPSSSTITNNVNNHRNNSHLKQKNNSVSSLPSSAETINRKRRTISVSSDDDIVELLPENDCQMLMKKRVTRQSTISPRKCDESIDQI